MSSGRYTMRGWAFQGRASAGWALAGGVVGPSYVGCTKAVQLYASGYATTQCYVPGSSKATQLYAGGHTTTQYYAHGSSQIDIYAHGTDSVQIDC